MENNLKGLQLNKDRHQMGLLKSVTTAFLRNTKVLESAKEMELILSDILEEFPKTSPETIKEAIRRGSLGHYGKVYLVNSSTISCWIRDHLEVLKKNRKTEEFKALSLNDQLKMIMKENM